MNETSVQTFFKRWGDCLVGKVLGMWDLSPDLITLLKSDVIEGAWRDKRSSSILGPASSVYIRQIKRSCLTKVDEGQPEVVTYLLWHIHCNTNVHTPHTSLVRTESPVC